MQEVINIIAFRFQVSGIKQCQKIWKVKDEEEVKGFSAENLCFCSEAKLKYFYKST